MAKIFKARKVLEAEAAAAAAGDRAKQAAAAEDAAADAADAAAEKQADATEQLKLRDKAALGRNGLFHPNLIQD